MFIKLTRINQNNEKKELVVDTTKIAFVSECEPHYNYDAPIGYEETTDENGVITKTPNEWESEKRYVVAFDNGRHPQILDEENYQTLINVLLANK